MFSTPPSSRRNGGGDTRRTVDMSDVSDFEIENRISPPQERQQFYMNAIREGSDNSPGSDHGVKSEGSPSSPTTPDCYNLLCLFCCPKAQALEYHFPEIIGTKSTPGVTFDLHTADRTEDMTQKLLSGEDPTQSAFFEFTPTIFQ